MRLSRPLVYPPVATPHGVHFVLSDRHRLIRRVVTRGALEFLAGRPLRVDELEDAFYSSRDGIEHAANVKHD
jgi:hypothetical protein